MATSFFVGGVDLDEYFQLGTRPGPNCGFVVGGSDLINRYQGWDGVSTRAPATGFYNTIWGLDLNTWFQKKVTAGFTATGSTVNDTATPPDVCRIGFQFNEDGTCSIDFPAGPVLTINWWTPTTGGIGASKYIYCGIVSGNTCSTVLGSDAPGAWVLVSNFGFGRHWFFQTDTTAPGSYGGTWRFYFSNDGGTVAHQIDLVWTAVQS